MINEDEELHLEHDCEGEDEAHSSRVAMDMDCGLHPGKLFQEYTGTLNPTGYASCEFREDGRVHLLPKPKASDGMIYFVVVSDLAETSFRVRRPYFCTCLNMSRESSKANQDI